MKSKNIETVGTLCTHTQDIFKYDFSLNIANIYPNILPIKSIIEMVCI